MDPLPVACARRLFFDLGNPSLKRVEKCAHISRRLGHGASGGPARTKERHDAEQEGKQRNGKRHDNQRIVSARSHGITSPRNDDVSRETSSFLSIYQHL